MKMQENQVTCWKTGWNASVWHSPIVTETSQLTASRHSCCDSILKETIIIAVKSPHTSNDDKFWSGKSAGPMDTIISINATSTMAGISLSRRGGFESFTSLISAKDFWLFVFLEIKVGPASRSRTSLNIAMWECDARNVHSVSNVYDLTLFACVIHVAWVYTMMHWKSEQQASWLSLNISWTYSLILPGWSWTRVPPRLTAIIAAPYCVRKPTSAAVFPVSGPFFATTAYLQ